MKNAKTPRNLSLAIKLYEKGWTLQMIGDKFGTSRQNINQWLQKAGVKSRSTGARIKFLDRKKLEKFYVEKKLTLTETARKLNTDYLTVKRELKRHGIEIRPRNLFLRKTPEIYNLAVGETIIISISEAEEKNPWTVLHNRALKPKIKITVKKLDEKRMSVTRIA